MSQEKYSLPRREEVPVEQTWDLRSMFESDEKWEKNLRNLKVVYPGLIATVVH